MRIIAAKPKLGELMIDFFFPLVKFQTNFILRISTADPKLRYLMNGFLVFLVESQQHFILRFGQLPGFLVYHCNEPFLELKKFAFETLVCLLYQQLVI